LLKSDRVNFLSPLYTRVGIKSCKEKVQQLFL